MTLQHRFIRFFCNLVLRKKTRYNSSMDSFLWNEAITNTIMPAFTGGIVVEEARPIVVGDIPTKLTVKYNPYALYIRGFAGAVVVVDWIGRVIIFVDDDYFALSKETKEFMIQHELGHIAHRHEGSTVLDRRLEKEHEADLYASRTVNAVIALESIKSIVKGKAKKEVEKRIQLLKA